jgi:hypothetical protein
VQAEGWNVGLVELSKDTAAAWRGEENTRMKAALVVKRQFNWAIPVLVFGTAAAMVGMAVF